MEWENLLLWWNQQKVAPKGYVSLVDHALAEGKVSVWQVGQSLQQDLWSHLRLEVGWVELVPGDILIM